MTAAGSTPDRAPGKGVYRASAPSADRAPTPLALTAESRALWELYALAKQQAEDSLLSADGLAAAQAFWSFVESFMPQVYGGNVVPLDLRRRLG